MNKYTCIGNQSDILQILKRIKIYQCKIRWNRYTCLFKNHTVRFNAEAEVSAWVNSSDIPMTNTRIKPSDIATLHMIYWIGGGEVTYIF